MNLPELARRTRRRRFLPLSRTAPYSTDYGFDRGEPVDRLFIHEFLGSHAADIRGRCLEVKDDRLTTRFGGDRVTSRDVLDLDAGNPRATVVGDLAAPATLAPARFDCFVLTQTLQYVSDVGAAIANAYAALAAGGTLLITVPSVSTVDATANGHDRWRLTPAGLRALAADACAGAASKVEGYGNPLAVTAFLYGLAVEDLDREALRRVDPLCPLIACARIVKPS